MWVATIISMGRSLVHGMFSSIFFLSFYFPLSSLFNMYVATTISYMANKFMYLKFFSRKSYAQSCVDRFMMTLITCTGHL
jgi:hypothetical protein